MATLSVAGSALGLVRDLTIATLFGASAATDAFVVAWTIPETATPLLMEGAMVALLVPLFSHELERTGSLRAALDGLVVPLLGFLAAFTAITALAAPVVVDVLAPGLDDRALAIRSVRVASLTILFLGTSGYLMAALRSREIFGWPGSVYIAYNVGLLATITVLHQTLGIFSAALGLAVGGACMVLIQVPAFVRRVGVPRPTLRPSRELVYRLSAFLPLLSYSLGRHSQVFVERFAGSLLAAGTISQVNYATKVGQLPMMLAVTVAAVTLPALSRSGAAGRSDRLASLNERNLRMVAYLIVPSTAFLFAFSPQIIALLFERGAFDPADTLATAGILRVYCFGLLGQVLVGVGVQSFVAVPGRTWVPARIALYGFLLTAAVTVGAVPFLGATGIALGNVAGISLMGLLLTLGLPKRGILVDFAELGRLLMRCIVSAGGAGLVGAAAARGIQLLLPLGIAGAAGAVTVGALALAVSYALFTWLFRVPETRDLVEAVRLWAVRVRGGS